MGRILGIDYGRKRIGIAATDPLQMIVSPLCTVKTSDIVDYLTEYLHEEKVDKIVIGLPFHHDGTPSYLQRDIKQLTTVLMDKFETIPIEYHDEAYSSVQAREILLQSGAKRKKRRDKGIVDRLSAVVILQEYLAHI